MVLHDTALDGSGAFRSANQTPCTVWPRTVMRGKSRKVNSGPNSVPKPARRTEPSSRNPRFAARPKGVAVQRRVWGSQEGAREPYGALAPFCPGRWAPASPPPDGGTPRPPKAATDHAMSWRTSLIPGGCKSRLQRRAAVSAEDFASADGKAERALIACGGTAAGTAEVYRQQTVKRGGRSAPVEKRVDRPLLGMV